LRLDPAETDHILARHVNYLGLITARGGSKSIPGKNIAPLEGRPLLAYTCDAAKASKRLTRVVLSTDDEAIAAVGRSCGVEVPFTRPDEIARDTTPSIEVALHAVKWLADHDGWLADVLVVLQPTSPLREARHIDDALDLLDSGQADTIVSVVSVPHRYSPYGIMRMESGLLRDFWDGPLPFDRFRRQDIPRLYARNGPAVLATRVPVLTEKQSFYGERVLPYFMDEADSIDIDTPLDLAMAAVALQARRARLGEV
jgi:CMP-N,N'-diacetyllegionaminic acid synthase